MSDRCSNLSKLFSKDIMISRTSVYLPKLPGSSPLSAYRHHRFLKNRCKVAYRNAARSIVHHTLFKTKNLNEILKRIFPTNILQKHTRSFKVSFASKHIVNTVLARRDRWVQCMYFTIHKLSALCKTINAQVELAADDNKSVALLGRSFHMKGWEPYFPEYSFKDGNMEYPLKEPGQCPNNDVTDSERPLFNPCNKKICVEATESEMDQIKNLLSTCASLNKKNVRTVLQNLDSCPSREHRPYLLVTDKRNHPEDCFRGTNSCDSEFVLLRKLATHHENIRRIYSLMNELRVINEIVADMDTALFCGDISYVIKLCDYMPPEKPSQVFTVTRPAEEVNKEYLYEKYGKHFTNYYKSLEDLPGPKACISCDKLVTNNKSSTITSKWNKLTNKAWTDLKRYLNSNERIITRGENKVPDDLVGQTVCNSCSLKLNKYEMPRVCVANGMDTGPSPACITELSPLESMFIHLAMCYQTVLKLSPMGANIPYNARMSSLKGFAVHIAAPIDVTLKELFEERPSRVVDPTNYIVLNGIPKKDRTVWQKIVRVDKIHTALIWLKEHNPLYANITIPSNPIDVLPDDEPNLSQDTDINDVQAGTQATDDLVNESDVETNPIDVLPDDEPNLTQDTDINDVQAGTQATDDLVNESDVESCKSGSVTDLSVPAKRRRCISGGNKLPPTDGKDNSSLINLVNHFIDSTNPSEDKISFMTDMPMRKKLKYLIIQRILKLCRLLIVSGRLCTSCDKDVRSQRSELGRLLGTSVTLINYEYLDLTSLTQIVLRFEDTWRHCSSASEYKENICVKCSSKNKKSTQKTNDNIKLKSDSHDADFIKGVVAVMQKQCAYLEKVDNLREANSLCDDCFVKQDRICKVTDYMLKKHKNEIFLISLEKKVKEGEKNLLTLQSVTKKASRKNHYGCVFCSKKSRSLFRRCKKIDAGLSEYSRTILQHHDKYLNDSGLANHIPEHVKENEDKFHARKEKSFRDNVINLEKLKEVTISIFSTGLLCNSLKCRKGPHDLLALINQLLKSKLYNDIKNKKVNFGLIDSDIFFSEALRHLQWFHFAKHNKVCISCQERLLMTEKNKFLGGSKNVTIKGGGVAQDDESIGENNADREIYDSIWDDDDIVLDEVKCDDIGLDEDKNYNDNDLGEDKNDDDIGLDEGKKDDAKGDDSNKEDEEKKSKSSSKKSFIDHMTEDDWKNLIENYTVTGLDNIDKNPEFMENLYQLLKVDNTPLSLEMKDLDLRCFPEVLPWGIGGRNSERDGAVMPLQYERARLLSRRGNIRRNIQYIFSLGQANERRKITQGVYASIRNVKGLKYDGTKDFIERLKKDDPNIERRLSRSVNKIPGTAQYWISVRRKIEAMMEEFGPPTWFITFNPAEYYWDDLIKYVRDNNKDLEGVDNLTDSELLAKDPVLVSNYMHMRFAAIKKFILEANPLGKVIHHFIRHEYQGRGMVHFHCVLWVEDAPVIGVNSDKEVVDFIQKYVSCKIPDQNTEPELHEIVMNCQQHSCRKYCLRIIKRGGRYTNACRFGFPRPESEAFQLHDVLSCVVGRKTNKMKKRLYDLGRSKDEIFINDYNPDLSFMWGGNTDIQFICENSFSIPTYITKYTVKSETTPVDSYITEDMESAFQKSSKFAYDSLRNREMSAHEVIDRMLQNNGDLYQISEFFQFVPNTLPRFRSRCLKKMSDLEKQEETDTDIFCHDFIHDYYPRRPSNLENMSLHEFVSKYDKCSLKDKSRDKILIESADGTKNIQALKPRNPTKIPVIQSHDFDVKEKPEMFFYSYLCLFKHWRAESDIQGTSESYDAEFFRLLDILPLMKEKYKRKVSMKKLKEEMEERANVQVPTNSQVNFENNDDSHDDDAIIADALKDYEAQNNNSTIQSDEQLQNLVQTLNPDQRRVYDKITGRLGHILDHKMGLCKDCPKDCPDNEPIHLYISGFGGTGKSYLINGLVGFMFVQKHVHGRPCDSILGAPTGLAADNIKGQTLHSVFRIPVEHGSHPKYRALSKTVIDQMRVIMKNLQCVIVDEVSMVSNIMLLLIHLRMGEIFNLKGLFGNKSIILFGDLLQLPPVHSDPPFIEITEKFMHKVTGGAKITLNLWRKFEFDELTINQRQVGDKNSRWKDLLYRIRIGTQTMEDIRLLSDRIIPISPYAASPDKILDELIEYYLKLESLPVCFMPTCEMAERFNSGIMKKQHPHFELCMAKDIIDCRTKSQEKNARIAAEKLNKLDDPRNTAGLEKSLPLTKGVTIMLRQNLSVAAGLFNGAMGEVVSLDRNHEGIIERLKVKFNHVDEPVNIDRVRRRIQLFEGAFLHREQFPICLSYAMTIHKSQCLTLDNVMVDLGNKVFAASQAYVALSRVTSLDGLHLINFNAKKIIVNKPALIEYARLGSKSVPSDKSNTEKPTTKEPKRITERVWYISSAWKKAQSFLETTIDESKEVKPNKVPSGKQRGRPREKRNTSVGESGKSDEPAKKRGRGRPNGAKNKKPKVTPTAKPSIKPNEGPKTKVIDVDIYTIQKPNATFIPVQHNPELSTRKILDLLDLCPRINDIISEYRIEDHNMLDIFRNIINRHGGLQSDMLRHRLAIELDPDPFNKATSFQKWLSSDIMDHYGWYLNDRAVHGRESVYYLSSLARYSYVQARNDAIRSIPEYIRQVHTQVQYSMLTDAEELERDHSPEKGLEVAGDPLSKDIIFTFVNDALHGHWYYLILDNRPTEKSVTLYDSGGFTQQNLQERCSFFIKYLNALNNYVNLVYNLGWSHNILRETDFAFRDGRSVKQRNSFDCGVYALLNAECTLVRQHLSNSVFDQNSIPFMRMHIIKNILEFCLMSGENVQL